MVSPPQDMTLPSKIGNFCELRSIVERFKWRADACVSVFKCLQNEVQIHQRGQDGSKTISARCCGNPRHHSLANGFNHDSISVQGKDKEIAKLEARAISAEGLLAEAKQKGEVEKGGALSSALAASRKASDEKESELRKAMREGEAKLKDRVERLENDNASLRR